MFVPVLVRGLTLELHSSRARVWPHLRGQTSVLLMKNGHSLCKVFTCRQRKNDARKKGNIRQSRVFYGFSIDGARVFFRCKCLQDVVMHSVVSRGKRVNEPRVCLYPNVALAVRTRCQVLQLTVIFFKGDFLNFPMGNLRPTEGALPHKPNAVSY